MVSQNQQATTVISQEALGHCSNPTPEAEAADCLPGVLRGHMDHPLQQLQAEATRRLSQKVP